MAKDDNLIFFLYIYILIGIISLHLFLATKYGIMSTSSCRRRFFENSLMTAWALLVFSMIHVFIPLSLDSLFLIFNLKYLKFIFCQLLYDFSFSHSKNKHWEGCTFKSSNYLSDQIMDTKNGDLISSTRYSDTFLHLS